MQCVSMNDTCSDFLRTCPYLDMENSQFRNTNSLVQATIYIMRLTVHDMNALTLHVQHKVPG